MTVTVYSKPNCVQCTMTYRAFDRAGVNYQVVDMTEDAAALTKVKEMGYLAAPVIIADDEHWAGFQPDRIAALAERVAA